VTGIAERLVELGEPCRLRCISWSSRPVRLSALQAPTLSRSLTPLPLRGAIMESVIIAIGLISIVAMVEVNDVWAAANGADATALGAPGQHPAVRLLLGLQLGPDS